MESTGARLFGLEEEEVIERRRYVSHVRQEIEVRIFVTIWGVGGFSTRVPRDAGWVREPCVVAMIVVE